MLLVTVALVSFQASVASRECSARIADRVDCGYPGIEEEEECSSKGCCWEPCWDCDKAVPRCYQKKPNFVTSPQDLLIEEGFDAEFRCEAEGNPLPAISWRRWEGDIPHSRSRISEDLGILIIHNAKVQDDGWYICEASNSGGNVEASARLTVHSIPTFLVAPSDQVVGAGRKVTLLCETTGNPPPAVFWNKAGSQTLMFPRQDHGRFSVTDEGTLIIKPVRKEDQGVYVCQALSVAGSAYSTAEITVLDVDTRPPPTILQGPQNQTLSIGSVATLECLTSGSPQPKIIWQRNGRLLTRHHLIADPRMTVLGSGALQISDLKDGDTAIYTCWAFSETGETTASAFLYVQ